LCLEIFKLTGVVESPTMASLSVISLDKKKIDTLLQKNRSVFHDLFIAASSQTGLISRVLLAQDK
jgi:hypothetical protein